MLVLVTLVALVVTACGGSGSGAPARTAAAQKPLPAGPRPSSISKMVCIPKTQRELAEVFGVKASVPAATWVHHRYGCAYRYPDGAMELSVKELSSWPETIAYFQALGRQLGVATKLNGLGQGAFQARDGSVVVRKDWKVLVVDTTGLPSPFGRPPTSSADVAVTVADVILGCWAGD